MNEQRTGSKCSKFSFSIALEDPSIYASLSGKHLFVYKTQLVLYWFYYLINEQ